MIEEFLMDKPVRKNIRLEYYDYRSYGAYFVTICTEDRKALFWKSPDELSMIGKIAENAICNIPAFYPKTVIEKYVIMPDHVHILMLMEYDNDDAAPSLSRVIKQLKAHVTKQAGCKIWQKSYYDRVIRNQEEYREIWEYIENNPLALKLKKEEKRF